MNTGQAENPSTERWKRARGPGEEEEEEEGRWRRAKIAAICIIYRVPPFGLLAAIYSARKSSETMHRCRERERGKLGGNNTFSCCFPRSGCKRKWTVPVVSSFARVHLFKYYEVYGLVKNSKSNRVFRHCPLPALLPSPTLASSFIFLPDFSRARAKREGGGKVWRTYLCSRR